MTKAKIYNQQTSVFLQKIRLPVLQQATYNFGKKFRPYRPASLFLFLFRVQHVHPDPGICQHIFRQLVGIRIFKYDPLNTRVDQNLCTYDTGLVSAVKGHPFYRHAMDRSLYDRVLLRMDPPAQLMVLALRHMQLFPQAANFPAVGHSLGSAVVACSENLFVFYDNRADTAAQAGRTLADHLGDLHKIMVPVRPHLISAAHNNPSFCRRKPPWAA